VPRRDTAERLGDILAAIDRIGTYSEGLTYERFSADVRTSDAVQYNFVVIGEAASRLPPEFTELHPELPWNEMRALRNVVAHAYFAVSLSVLWETMTSDLPPLIEPLRALLAESVSTASESSENH
jgi:uncharacterized protein with HEPN domain